MFDHWYAYFALAFSAGRYLDDAGYTFFFIRGLSPKYVLAFHRYAVVPGHRFLDPVIAYTSDHLFALFVTWIGFCLGTALILQPAGHYIFKEFHTLRRYLHPRPALCDHTARLYVLFFSYPQCGSLGDDLLKHDFPGSAKFGTLRPAC
mmetsp:Transcript_750/g.1532  ORF Transcript_750/g.1532 Transcript_750/m.1532 type:complete len:148 (+) Transcript_750:145-588(+)